MVQIAKVDFRHKVSYRRQEDNVCLLDLAEYALDDGGFEPMEEILRIDKKLREKFEWPQASGQDVQPWAMEKEKTTHSVTLRFVFYSEESFEHINFCTEEISKLVLNGENVDLQETGYFVDKAIKKYNLPNVKKGINMILAQIPFAKERSLEACYLTGDFDVFLSGSEKTLAKAKARIGFGDITTTEEILPIQKKFICRKM